MVSLATAPDRETAAAARAARSTATARPVLCGAVDLRVTTGHVGATVLVVADGPVDLATVPALHDHLVRAIVEHPGVEVAVDLDAVTSLDDCGLGVLLGAAGRARSNGGDLVVVCSGARLRERLARTGFDRAVTVRTQVAGSG